MLNCFSLKEVLSDNKTITNIILKMENYFATRHAYVTFDTLNFSDKEIAIINKYPKIFFKCTPKRILLVKWIIDETENLFRDNNASAIFLEKLYDFLRNRFKTYSFNRHNLQELFSMDNILEYDAFVSVRNTVLNEYNKFYNTTRNRVNPNSVKLKTSERIKKIINEIFAEDVFDINGYNQSQCDGGMDLSPEEKEIKNKIMHAKEDLGDEICVELLKNTNATLYLFELLSQYVNQIEEEEHIKQLINTAIENVNENLLQARLKSLLLAYRIDNELKDSILQLFKNNRIVFVRELPKLLTVSIENKIKSPVLNFVEWLSDDKVAAIQKEFKKIFKTERDTCIMKMRAAGATLEAAGQVYSITRERVRQIERKVLARFNSFVSRARPYYILQAFTESDTVLTVELIKNHLSELSDVFIYCLKECNSKEVMWSNKLKGFIIGDSTWYEQLSEYVDTLPDMFEASDLDIYISNALGLPDIEVDRNLVSELILDEYNLVGNIYSKRKIGKADVYLAVLERYYPHGIKLFDDFEMMRFRNYAKDLFGDIKLPENDRAICARIADITVLCDRGKYILPSKIRFDDKTLDKIYHFIMENERNVIMFGELFERFKSELLEKTNINNRFYLQGVLKYKYANKFFFTKDTLIKDINSEQDVKLSIEEFIKEQGRIVTKDEVREEFLGITEAVLLAAIASNPNILLWDFGKYLHAKQLVVDDAIKGRLKKLLDDYTAQGSVSVRKIYSDIYVLENDFLLSNNIEGHVALCSVFNFLFPDDYEFSRPYIAPKGSTATTFDAVLREYLSSFDEVYISDLKEYIESMKKGNFSVSVLLDDISDEFIRVDSDLLIRKDRLDLSEDIIECIEETTLALIGDTGYLSVKKIIDYMFYPDIGVKWTPFLLVSVVKYFCKRLKIINTAADYRYLNEVIVDGSLNIDDYDELLRYALKQEAKYTSFRNMQETKRFLLDQELIANNIPQSLFDKGYILEEEYGGIVIV
ncbi:MAG: sigma factor-like helix-turn-helix DNA-binding protein [Bacillota bacterium]|nr:sigma factor-like helix-turn-helix DNA-binding protein [Bacillota bacterium]